MSLFSARFDAAQGIVMEEALADDIHPKLGIDHHVIVYKVSVKSGHHAGWAEKNGADYNLYDCQAKLLRTIKGRLAQRKEESASDASNEADIGLTLLCKVCQGRIPLDQVEPHAKICAISFPVQIIRFEHSVEPDEREDKKKMAMARKGEAEIAVLEDFPVSVLNALEKSGVPKEMYSKHLGVLVNVLNFASKMKFRLAANRPSLLVDAALYALKNNLEPQLLSEVCKVAHGGAGRGELKLAHAAVYAFEEGLLLLNGQTVPPPPVPESREAEGKRILAAQKDVQVQAIKLFDHMSQKNVKRLYTMSKKIGEGGYGKVYNARCKDKKMKPEIVAIKVMQHEESDAKAKRTNLRELLYLNKLKHKNIVELYRAHLVNDSELWLVIEYMEGGTLREASKSATFAEGEVAYCAHEILQAVAFMHAHGCVHRDIKSHNVMMTVEGHVKLIDLGLVADVVKGISTMRGILGTTYWIPPEMIRGEPHSYPADIWSLGICLLELCHGYPPNRDSKLRALFLAGAGIAPGLEEPEKWSEACGDFFSVCLVPEQLDRASAEDLLSHRWTAARCSLVEIRSRLRQIFLTSALVQSGFMG